jgi:hypothetical protein
MTLIQKIVKVSELDAPAVDRMFQLMERHYSQVDRKKFEKDLEEKEGVLILYDEQDKLQGFSTYCYMHIEWENEALHAVFSGDTIVNQSVWGSRAPIYILLDLFKKAYARYPENLYWFLISKGHRTYLLLPLLFKSFYPAWNYCENCMEKALVSALSTYRFGEKYDAKRELILEGADRLKSAIAQPKRSNKHIDFFLKKNPDYLKGVELPCIAQINEDNMSAFAMRYLKSL